MPLAFYLIYSILRGVRDILRDFGQKIQRIVYPAVRSLSAISPMQSIIDAAEKKNGNIMTSGKAHEIRVVKNAKCNM